jgi:hypothetical protein
MGRLVLLNSSAAGPECMSRAPEPSSQFSLVAAMEIAIGVGPARTPDHPPGPDGVLRVGGAGVVALRGLRDAAHRHCIAGHRSPRGSAPLRPDRCTRLATCVPAGRYCWPLAGRTRGLGAAVVRRRRIVAFPRKPLTELVHDLIADSTAGQPHWLPGR